MEEVVVKKNDQLGEILQNMESVLIAFSGGIDSTFLLRRAVDELGGDNVLAVVVDSELFRDDEFTGAIDIAKSMGAQVKYIEMKELENPHIVANETNSWYHSKKMLYENLNRLAMKHGFPYVLDGMIADDKDDFRPGLRARTEAGVRSVLQEVDLYKREIRSLSKALDIPIWDKPASCSLASRIPYGTKVTAEKIAQIDQAEKFILKLGFEVVRVRHHGDVARIEVPADDIPELVKYREQINLKFKALGFSYVAIDMTGYRTGSMNETLHVDELKV